ncbi:MAG TPA: HAD-IA family hydrolase [Chthoniobacteraceae bacterium]|nr:HAD-IA family hydrolase [Chthoniobacteraceae bacterium]
MNDIRAIAFDAAGTLIHLPKGAAHHYAEVAARHGLVLDPVQLSQAFRRVWATLPPPAATLTRRPDDDRSWWWQLVNEVLDQCNVSPGSFHREAYFGDLYAEFALPGIWECYPEVRTVLDDLSQRFTFAVMSNFDGRLRSVLDHLDLTRYFKEVVISSEVGAEKPHPWIFKETARLLGFAPAEILHVGDDPDADWRGAAGACFQVFELRRPANSLHNLLGLLNA